MKALLNEMSYITLPKKELWLMDDICTIILFQILLAQAERLFLAINNH